MQGVLFSKTLLPDFDHEQQLQARGFHAIAGIDEVGRGPLAGPVVTAAVILDLDNVPQGLNDSKKLSAAKRLSLYEDILNTARSVAISSLAAPTIDQCNILQATLRAMQKAVSSLAIKPDYCLIDGRDIPPNLPCPAQSLIKGDQRSVSIAAASIIAKVTRDHMMENVAKIYPAYGFEKHVGYGTVVHRQAIADQGPLPRIHRYSFAPIRDR